MTLRKRRNLLVFGLAAITLSAVVISCRHPLGNRPDRGEDRDITLPGHTVPVQALAFGPDGTTLTSSAFYTKGRTGGVEMTVWDVRTGYLVTKRIEYPGGVHSLVFTPGGQRLAAVQERDLLLWDMAPWREQRLEGPLPLVSALALSDDGTQLAAADRDDLTLWDPTESRPMARWTQHDGAVSLAFAPGGTVVSSGGVDGVIRLWDTATGQPRGNLRGHAKPVIAVTYSPDGVTVASAEFRGAVKLWDMATLTERATLEMSGGEVSAVAFAPDGRTLAVAADQAVQLWDVAEGSLLASLRGHEAQVNCLAYSPDGARLASGSSDKTVRLWDVTRYRPKSP
jgi:WD40 repeat protein